MQVLLDAEVVVEENGLSPLFEIEEDMPQDREISALTNRVAALESNKASNNQINGISGNVARIDKNLAVLTEGMKWQKSFLTYAVVAAVAWMGAITYFLIPTMGRVSALEGRGGSYKVTEQALGKSNTPEEVAVNLNLLQAQIHKRILSKDPLDAVELAQVGVTLSSVANRYPDDAAVWNASSHLVNIRYQRDVPANLPNCWDFYKGHTEDGKQPPSRPAPKDFAAVDEQRVGNCQLTLDDGPSYRNSGFGKAYERNLKDFPAMKLQITAHDVIVSYNGGKIIPFSFLECRNCVFKLNVSHVPPSDGQRTVRRLLTADTSSVQIPGSQSGL